MFGAFSSSTPNGTPHTNCTSHTNGTNSHTFETLPTDGCTSLSWLTPTSSYLAQNWDWMNEQKPNLLALTILPSASPPSSKLTIKIITEAGLIGKIGLNSHGVGVCLNALRKHGVNWDALPCHLGLRLVLECSSRKEAIKKLDEAGGVASACHFLIADGETGGVGLEWCSEEREPGRCEMDGRGVVVHTNHYLVGEGRKNVPGESFFMDSPFRVGRMRELVERLGEERKGEIGIEDVGGLFRDEENWPGAICRAQVEPSSAATLFNIVMELKGKRAVVKVGRPTEVEGEVVLSF